MDDRGTKLDILSLLWRTEEDQRLAMEAYLIVKFQWLCAHKETNGISLSCLSRKCSCLRGEQFQELMWVEKKAVQFCRKQFRFKSENT